MTVSALERDVWTMPFIVSFNFLSALECSGSWIRPPL